MDPIFQANQVGEENDFIVGKWYFWDEVWAHPMGPFDTEEIARDKLEEYFNLLSVGADA